MKVRIARIEDLDTINSFLLDMQMLPFNTVTFYSEHRFLRVLEIENLIIGLLSFIVVAEEAELEAIYIVPEERKKGLSTLLLKQLIEECKNKLCKKIFLEVRENNFNAIMLYEHNGFEYISKRKKYYGNDDALIMCKEIV